GQPTDVLLERGSQLKQDRPELAAERAGAFEEESQRVVYILETSDMRDPLRRLEDEGEAGWRGRVPPRDDLRGRHPVECVVDLHRGEPLCVILKHARGGQLGRVKRALPLGVVVA